MRYALGALLAGLPLAAIVAGMVRVVGWRASLTIWAISLSATAAMVTGLFLLVNP